MPVAVAFSFISRTIDFESIEVSIPNFNIPINRFQGNVQGCSCLIFLSKSIDIHQASIGFTQFLQALISPIWFQNRYPILTSRSCMPFQTSKWLVMQLFMLFILSHLIRFASIGIHMLVLLQLAYTCWYLFQWEIEKEKWNWSNYDLKWTIRVIQKVNKEHGSNKKPEMKPTL